MKLPKEYYRHPDVIFLSRDLLGKFLLTNFDDILTGGMIVETEAYRAPEDRASHAYGCRRTKRNETMYWEGGTCYVFTCYGIHSLFNIVTNEPDIPHAVLIRAILPEIGVDDMLKRRGKAHLDKTVAGGPGALTQALGINTTHNGINLTGTQIWLEDRGIIIDETMIVASPRVNIDYAGEDALLPWRFRIIQEKLNTPTQFFDCKSKHTHKQQE